jgi:branched-subunit amino acid aminotransferase/4-amino-4-deoxychorismate lyase
VWEHKIKATKHALKEWIKNPNKTPSIHRRETFQLLTDLQMEIENKDITNQDLEKEQAAQFNSFRSFRQ